MGSEQSVVRIRNPWPVVRSSGSGFARRVAEAAENLSCGRREQGRKILAESGFNFTVADGMRDAAEKVVRLAVKQ